MLNSLNSKNGLEYYKALWAVVAGYHRSWYPQTLLRRVKFLSAGKHNKAQIDAFIARMNASKVEVTPAMMGVLEWPYLHNHWDVETKLDRIATHYEALAQDYHWLTQVGDKPIELMNFDYVSKGVTLAIDYTRWFIREGQLVLNIFQNDLRVASLAFILSKKQSELVAYIGAVQGIHSGVSTEESLEIYKVLTKDFEGLRPRSLLVEALKVVLTQLNVKRLYAVSEQHRHHRHRYFRNTDQTIFKNDYNPFWEEHEGVISEGGFYELPLKLAIKDMAEIPSKKRSMYRRRYEIIENMKQQIKLQQHV